MNTIFSEHSQKISEEFNRLTRRNICHEASRLQNLIMISLISFRRTLTVFHNPLRLSIAVRLGKNCLKRMYGPQAQVVGFIKLPESPNEKSCEHKKMHYVLHAWL
ncbi:hypothetical protein RRG08_023740 [Elysia crispata]|uniref:Uncharacterized protein n=1 Tax=Elysia crispata TaxID=231223 RepID=A0AAE1DN16_9GAST|nr:hypothetical protein RRG08_023740 [Elysia crispata]